MTRFITVIFLSLCLFLSSCRSGQEFACVQNGGFRNVENPYFIGTNLWYGPILASDGEGGDIARLERELDYLKSLGVTNLRVLVGCDGKEGVATRIQPTLQTEAGVYNETLLRGLDRFLVELGKRDMQAVLFLNNSWEWSGGYGMYLEWATGEKALIPAESGYPAYMDWAGSFVSNDEAKELFFNHVRAIVSRTNSITGKAYADDPAIFSWQIGNEPRCFSSDPKVQDAFVDWMWKSAALIKSIDRNHMVSSGSEGKWGCEGSIELFERIHSCPDIDYLNIHIWPYNWSWVREESLDSRLEEAFSNTDEYINEHIEVAGRLGKPIVIEEFGYPRDGFIFTKGSSTAGRDAYYSHIFNRVLESAREGGMVAGCNFWAWGGFAGQAADHINWIPGDDYCGDPAQEQQGLNSVYEGDSTIGVISEANSQLKDIIFPNH